VSVEHETDPALTLGLSGPDMPESPQRGHQSQARLGRAVTDIPLHRAVQIVARDLQAVQIVAGQVGVGLLGEPQVHIRVPVPDLALVAARGQSFVCILSDGFEQDILTLAVNTPLLPYEILGHQSREPDYDRFWKVIVEVHDLLRRTQRAPADKYREPGEERLAGLVQQI